MSIQSTTVKFTLANHCIEVGQNLVFSISNKAGDQIFQQFLPESEICLRVVEEDGQMICELGEFLVGAPLFNISLRQVDEYPVFQVTTPGGGLGVGDLRDVRIDIVGHHYDLMLTPVMLKSDGLYLTIYSLSDPGTGIPIGYEKVESLEQAGFPGYGHP